MNNRIKEIIEYKADGKRNEFARSLGWTPPYLYKLLRGESIGIAPVLTILTAFPDIDARWLLLGEGEMLKK